MKNMASLVKWLVILVLALTVLGATACSSSSNPATSSAPTVTGPNTGLITNPGSGTPSAASVTINVSAKNMAFDTNTISVLPGAKVTLIFTNNDSGIRHNVAVYFDSTAAKSIFVGQIITGVNSVTYNFTAPTAPGTYFFRCDIHPTAMTGQFIVTPNNQ
jgi:plastocyanin